MGDPQEHTIAIQDALQCVVRMLVIEKHNVEIIKTDCDGTIHFQIIVSKSDLGHVIGKQGRTARAIRTLMNASSHGRLFSYSLQILARERNEKPQSTV